MQELTPDQVIERFNRAKQNRGVWEGHWQECYDFALPNRSGFFNETTQGEKRTDKLFDGTAPDAVDQLAASMLAQLTPPWASWFGLMPGAAVPDEDQEKVRTDLEESSKVMQMHFERSNFSIEMHQCYLDLVTVGSACLLFEEAAPGETSAFRFTAIPLSQVMMEEGPSGRLSDAYRRSEMTMEALKVRFPEAKLPFDLQSQTEKAMDKKFNVVEAVVENETRFEYLAVLESGHNSGEPVLLRRGLFAHSPFICFRWLKAPGETYGRSPVMKALPDIKTANKVVELALKNASISVTGIWQADDDGVLNPANIRLVPGSIIPKAVGSAGLTPLQSAGNFDLSQVILEELRKRIRHALLADKLGVNDAKQMTATEILERSAEMARILGATFGRLQSELLTPLIIRGLSILGRRGEIGVVNVDGRFIDLHHKSPLALRQSQKEAQDILSWMQSLSGLGPEAMALIDPIKTAKFLARAYGVPSEIFKTEEELAEQKETGISGETTDMNAVMQQAQSIMQNPEQLQEIMGELGNVQQQ